MPKRKRGDNKSKLKDNILGQDENSQEAIEDRISLNDDDDEENNEEPEGEDIMNENMMDDYKPIKELDRYEKEDLDDNEYENMTPEERKRVEKLLAERDERRKRQYGSRVPAALLAEMEEEGEEDEAWRLKRKK